MAYLALKDAAAKDWHSKLAISRGHQGRTHSVEWHHIFPKATLKLVGVENNLINELANMAFIGGQTNRRIGKRAAAEYLVEIAEGYGEAALSSQCIPLNRELWDVDRYADFLQARREALAARMNAFIEKKAGFSELIG